MNQGRKAALALAAGVVSGSIFWGFMAATGVSAILSRYAQALILLKIFGGLYLLYLGYKAGKSALAPNEQALGLQEKNGEKAPSTAGLYQRGLLMHLANPKSILSWISLMTLGLGPGSSPRTLAIILGGCIALGMTIFFGYALAFSTEPMVRIYRRARRGIETILGLFFGIAGLKLLISST